LRAKVMLTTMPPMVVKFHVLLSLVELAPHATLPLPVGALLLLAHQANLIATVM